MNWSSIIYNSGVLVLTVSIQTSNFKQFIREAYIIKIYLIY